MKDGFVKVAAVTPNIRVADTEYNTELICRMMAEAALAGAKLLEFPELCITVYTCGDLFLQSHLLSKAREGLKRIVEESRAYDALCIVGLPYEIGGKL